ncbi:MAG: hypothetical protein KBS91_01840 [Firmicutes bacterium]|nr:hypothetical protein [Candidatus Caballimonas caccae]
MITTRRSGNGSNEMLYENENGGIALLERDFFKAEARTEEYDEAKNKERMQKNLYNLLNYDRFSENMKIEETVQETEEVVNQVYASSDEDITPTSTTMQFGDIDANTMHNEMQHEESDTSYKLNKKGKIVIALYSVCIAVVMALIIINASVIAMLSNRQAELNSELQQVMAEYNEAKIEADYAMSEENIINLAENVYNMIK